MAGETWLLELGVVVMLLCSQGAERDELWCSDHLLVFIQSRKTGHGMVPPIFNMASTPQFHLS